MSDEKILSRGSAVLIYVWLIVLTLLEVLIVRSGVTKTIGAILMGGTTLAKVMMIGLYFMHLKFDRRVAWLLPAIPILLALIFVTALFPDIVFHLPLRFPN